MRRLTRAAAIAALALTVAAPVAANDYRWVDSFGWVDERCYVSHPFALTVYEHRDFGGQRARICGTETMDTVPMGPRTFGLGPFFAGNVSSYRWTYSRDYGEYLCFFRYDDHKGAYFRIGPWRNTTIADAYLGDWNDRLNSTRTAWAWGGCAETS